MLSWWMITRAVPTEGKEIMVPVTVIEIPSMKVAAIRAYSRDTYGKHALTEVWADQLDAVLGRRITLPKDYDQEAAQKKFSEALQPVRLQKFMRFLIHNR